MRKTFLLYLSVATVARVVAAETQYFRGWRLCRGSSCEYFAQNKLVVSGAG